MPPAVQNPLTAAMIGFQMRVPRNTALVSSSRRYPPTPVAIATHASHRSLKCSMSAELRASGRSIVTSTMCSSSFT